MAAAAAAIGLSMMFAGAAARADTSSCGPVPDAQPPLPAGTVLAWSIESGACVLVTQQYECAQANGEPC
jgi:hypothetical protein